MSDPRISALPTAPSRNDAPDTFTTRANSFVAALPDFVTEANALADTVEGYKDSAAQSVTDAADQVALAADQVALAADQVTLAEGQVTLAEGQVTLATTQATNAANSATAAAANANFAGNWGDLTGALNIPASVQHDGSIWQLLTDLADVTTSEPSDVNSDWARIIPVTVDGSVEVDDLILGGALDITITADTVGGTLSDDYLHLIDGGLAVTLPGAVAGKRLKVIGNWADTVVSADNAITITGASGDSIIAGEDSIDTAVELDTRGEFEFIAIDGDRWVFTR